jgi:hypothetical protein
MTNDIQAIRDASTRAAALLRSLETAAIRARESRNEQVQRDARGEVASAAGALAGAVAEIAKLAAPTAVPDPVTDLDQDPQD